MSALTFKLKAQPQQRVDLSPLTPDTLAGLSNDAIAAIELQSGNRKITVGDLFDISSGSASSTDDETVSVIIENGCSKLDYIGNGMTRGSIVVRGDCGAYVAFNMRGGALTIEGNVGAYAGCGMKSGVLRIAGNAGDFLGAALPGFRHGMAGGTIIVSGSAGERIGDHMRRGAILIEGNAGDYCGSRMLAGTIAVLGEVGEHCGFGMKRGTLLLSSKPQKLSALFSDCGTHNLNFLPLLIKSWRALPGRFAEVQPRKRVRRYAGDNANGGKGEILVWAD
ncbi:MAG: formylmethanofuran dehydrogenase subunit C [Burkholderiales bacterium]|nr:formylmethanofuran dehydrogenase subunit C [Burkholderiales bacterium]